MEYESLYCGPNVIFLVIASNLELLWLNFVYTKDNVYYIKSMFMLKLEMNMYDTNLRAYLYRFKLFFSINE